MEKPSKRPQRIRRHSRKAWPPEEEDLHHERLTKRLFTPEIKRMLKEWLIRRRENPYPSRDEKKRLAIETGLTYTQICNWFANWRRKLKNSEREKAQSWGHLIKHYNSNARGNVEQFSISSEDSIWEEEEFLDGSYEDGYYEERRRSGSIPLLLREAKGSDNESQMRAPSSMQSPPQGNSPAAKYKHKMMQKYLRDIHSGQEEADVKPLRLDNGVAEQAVPLDSKPEVKELTKWLESAAKFTPNKSNYNMEWNHRRGSHCEQSPQNQGYPPSTSDSSSVYSYEDSSVHHKDELEAAEALTKLAFNCRQKMLEATPINETMLGSLC